MHRPFAYDLLQANPSDKGPETDVRSRGSGTFSDGASLTGVALSKSVRPSGPVRWKQGVGLAVVPRICRGSERDVCAVMPNDSVHPNSSSRDRPVVLIAS